MERHETAQQRKERLRKILLKGFFLYALVSALVLLLAAGPVTDAVRSSDRNVFLILPAALFAVCLNWYVYYAIHKKRPPLPVFAHGALVLLIVVILEHEALAPTHPLTSTLTVIGACLVLAFLTLLTAWFASLPSKPAHAASVFIRVLLDMFLCLMVYQVISDFENGFVSADTFIIIFVTAALIAGLNARKILSSFRRSSFRRKACCQTDGRIDRIVGETYLDLDDDQETVFHARILYTVQDVPYEIRTGVTRHVLRRYGKENFLGKTIPVFYDPEDPSRAWTNKLDRHFFELPQPEETAPDAQS